MRKKNKIILKYCNMDLGGIMVSSDPEAQALSHSVISTFSRRSFLSANLEGKISEDVKRSLDTTLRCIPKVIKRRRRFLEIFKTEQEEEEDESFSLSEKNLFLSCPICDIEFLSSEELESHKKIHSVQKSSSLALERQIGNQ